MPYALSSSSQRVTLYNDVMKVADTWGLCFTRWNDKVSVRRCSPFSSSE
ncbi:hypothetical protein [Wolbachia pipientis]|uniref:Uncharacterized protein n=1 Tax=Wolbachia pipientis TaxID=955 RepID=A0A7G5CDH2_WOLPI|nr:hypothetical protein [Wolbachia pipientis]QMV47256.1 hypothetical protein HC356_04520 [Wolbachia pipientis]